MDISNNFTASLHEVWDLSPNSPTFSHTDVYLVYENEIRHFTSPLRPKEISEQSIDPSIAQGISTEDIWPLPPSSLTIFQGELRPEYYVKGPDLGNYFTFQELGKRVSDLLLHEAGIYESFTGTSPHIAQYHGCILGSDGRIRGLCLDKYTETLLERVEDSSRPLDINRIKAEIREALNYMHAQGLAHNDIRLLNVMVDDNDTAIVIDFDSTHRVGDKIGFKAGHDETRTESWVENDERDFKKLVEHLEKLYWSRNKVKRIKLYQAE